MSIFLIFVPNLSFVHITYLMFKHNYTVMFYCRTPLQCCFTPQGQHNVYTIKMMFCITWVDYSDQEHVPSRLYYLKHMHGDKKNDR